MKPTQINAGFRTIRLAYQNDKAPSPPEQRVLAAYPKLHYELHRLETAFAEFEEGLPGLQKDFTAAVKALQQLEPDCLVLEYFYLKPDEQPPPGVTLPKTHGTADTNAVIEKAQSLNGLLQPLYRWNEEVHPRYKQWRKEYNDFRESIEVFQDDVMKVNENWRKGTIDITALDKDEQEFYGYVDALWKRLTPFSKEYNAVMSSYNDFIHNVGAAFDIVNTVGNKVKKKLEALPLNPDNLNMN